MKKHAKSTRHRKSWNVCNASACRILLMSQAARNLPDAWSSGRAKPREQVLLEHIVPQNYNIEWTTHEKFALEKNNWRSPTLKPNLKHGFIISLSQSAQLLLSVRSVDLQADSWPDSWLDDEQSESHSRRRAISRRRGTRLESSNQLYGWRTLARKQKPCNSTQK